ncbi:CRISPR-associated endonuclease Cas3'' [Megalodesulfovibrio paquesii]
MPQYLAHSKAGTLAADWQPLDEHLQRTAALARGFAEAFCAGSWGEAAGLLHDLGKCSPEFQEYLRDQNPERRRRGGDHASCGAQWAAEQWGDLGKMLAACIAGHHGGLPDGQGTPNVDLRSRLKRTVHRCPPESLGLHPVQPTFWPLGNTPSPFAISFFIRMLYSCLVDADFLDTERFLNPAQYQARAGWAALPELAERFFPRLEAKAAQAAREHPGPVNNLRAQVLEDCLTAAALPPGLFTLTVPTGGGKTLSSMAFALRHALAHDLRRIVYVIPYTSIIEQNADVFREFLGREDAVLEHHSAYALDEADKDDAPQDEESDQRNGRQRAAPASYAAARRHRLAAENWDAHVIATTAVQFFESLFAHQPSRCRKLHALARSVIILDEAQMLPQPLLRPCLEALQELTRHYGATIVLCTATQPALLKREDFRFGLPAGNVREIIRDPNSLHTGLRRTRLEWAGVLTDDALEARLAPHPQSLLVVNTRRRARELFHRLQHREGCRHLSATMTPAHRSRALDEIRSRLRDGLPCLVVSTSLIECGVDIDLPIVFRELCGLDSAAQAAGRCNREGRSAEPGLVVLFRPETGLPKHGDARQRAEITEEVLRHHGDDPFAPAAVEQYFRHLFWVKGAEQLDKPRIMNMLQIGLSQKTYLEFPFKAVSNAFRLMDDVMQPVVVALDAETRTLVDRLEFAEFPGPILRQLQRHTVQVHHQEFLDLAKAGALRLAGGGVAVLENPDLYSETVGLDCTDPTYSRPENLIS